MPIVEIKAPGWGIPKIVLVPTPNFLVTENQHVYGKTPYTPPSRYGSLGPDATSIPEPPVKDTIVFTSEYTDSGFYYVKGTNITIDWGEGNTVFSATGFGEIWPIGPSGLTTIITGDIIEEVSAYSELSYLTADITGAPNLKYWDVWSTEIPSIDLSQNPKLEVFEMLNSWNLTSVDFSNNPLINRIQLDNCSNLNEAAVENILVTVESFGTSGGTIDMRWGPAPIYAFPNPAFNAYEALVARGWTVNVDIVA